MIREAREVYERMIALHARQEVHAMAEIAAARAEMGRCEMEEPPEWDGPDFIAPGLAPCWQTPEGEQCAVCATGLAAQPALRAGKERKRAARRRYLAAVRAYIAAWPEGE